MTVFSILKHVILQVVLAKVFSMYYTKNQSILDAK